MNDAKRNLGNVEKNLCPCLDCKNLTRLHGEIIVEHLIIKGMDPKYISSEWYNHGEQINKSKKTKSDDVYDLLKAIIYEDEDFINHTFFL